MKLTKSIATCVIHVFIVFQLCNAALADTPVRVLILPLHIHSEKNLAFLQSGIEDMLSTRLAVEGRVVPFSKEAARQAFKDVPKPINEETAVSLGVSLTADYVLFGSLTVFGNSISTDVRFVDVHQKKSVVTFSQFGEDPGDVITHINLFAAQINEKVFGRKTDSHPTSEQQQPAVDIRSHPDSLWAGDQRSGADFTDATPADKNISFSFWKSRNFKTKIIGVAVGDVDGDGQNETVFINQNTLFIYRYNNQRFEKVAEVSGDGRDSFIGVDTADINNNGKSEIFVTNLINNHAGLRSFVLEWDGKNFKRIIEKSNWYYRVLHLPEHGGDILMGQQRSGNNIFKKRGIYKLIWSNGQYEPAQQQLLPKHINIYGFTYGDALNNGNEMIVAFAQNGHIQIFDKNGNEQWESAEPFGGSGTYIEGPPYTPPKASEENRRERYYLPQRIHIADMDGDGKKELIVAENIDITGKLLPRVKIFRGGHIKSFDLDKLGLFPKWKTREISGHISDYTIADLNNDGKKELVFSAVDKADILSTTSKSYIVSMEVSKQGNR